MECKLHTVEKEPSPSILPNLKSSGFFLRGCDVWAAGCVRRSETWLLVDPPTARASEAEPSMLGQWLLLAPGIASGEQESGWFLTIDGCEQEQMTRLGWIGTTSYCNRRGSVENIFVSRVKQLDHQCDLNMTSPKEIWLTMYPSLKMMKMWDNSDKGDNNNWNKELGEMPR